jgi:outer membrane protein assembly factor BamB
MYDKDPDIYCVDPDTGNTVWSYQVTGGENGCGQSSPCIKGDSVFAETVTGYVVRLSALDGKEIWRAKVGQNGGTNSPISANGKIFACGQGGMLTSFDETTGRTLWSCSTGTGYIFGSPTYWKGNIYVPSLDGSVTCIREDMP